MKNILALAAVVSALACAGAHAASLHGSSSGQFTRIYAFHLDGENLNTQFNTVVFRATSFGEFTDQDGGLQGGIPRPAEQPFSYYNRLLDLHPMDPVTPGGLGWLIPPGVTNTNSELSFTGANLFGMISTANQPNGRLFLANVYMPLGGGTVNVELFRNGQLVANLGGLFGPEPASIGMSGMAMLGLAAFRRSARRGHVAKIATGRTGGCV